MQPGSWSLCRAEEKILIIEKQYENFNQEISIQRSVTPYLKQLVNTISKTHNTNVHKFKEIPAGSPFFVSL